MGYREGVPEDGDPVGRSGAFFIERSAGHPGRGSKLPAVASLDRGPRLGLSSRQEPANPGGGGERGSAAWDWSQLRLP